MAQLIVRTTNNTYHSIPLNENTNRAKKMELFSEQHHTCRNVQTKRDDIAKSKYHCIVKEEITKARKQALTNSLRKKLEARTQ